MRGSRITGTRCAQAAPPRTATRRAGTGVVQMPLIVVADDLARGDLVHVLPDWLPKRGIVHAVYPSRRCLLPSVRALLDHLVERFDALGDD